MKDPAAWASVIVAVTGLLTAVGALIHSKNTRKAVTENDPATRLAPPV